MENNKLENIIWVQAVEKFRKFGDLGVTAEDHLNISSTPDDELQNNPGKTLGEIWDDTKIENFLKELKQFISTEQESEGMKNYQKQQIQNFESTIAYLKSINRLPKDFN